MIVNKYLIIKANRPSWKAPKVDLRDRVPNLGGNEIALKLRIEIPDELF